MNREIDEDERNSLRNQVKYHKIHIKQLNKCHCGDELPGHCPGPINCPYSTIGEDNDE